MTTIIFYNFLLWKKERVVVIHQPTSHNNHLLSMDRNFVSSLLAIDYGRVINGLHNITQFGRWNAQILVVERFFLRHPCFHSIEKSVLRFKIDFYFKILIMVYRWCYHILMLILLLCYLIVIVIFTTTRLNNVSKKWFFD